MEKNNKTKALVTVFITVSAYLILKAVASAFEGYYAFYGMKNLIVAVPVIILAIIMNARRRNDLALYLDPGTALKISVLCFSAVAGITGGALVNLIPKAGGAENPSEVLPVTVILILLNAASVAFAEEFIFRKLFTDRMLPAFGKTITIISGSLIFSLLHFDPVSCAVMLPFGAVASMIYITAGKITPCIIFHMMFNAASDLLFRTGTDLPLPVHAASALLLILAVTNITIIFLKGKNQIETV